MYNYEEAIKNDVIDYINSNINAADYEDREQLEESLNDDLWAEDSITGNASGSYTFNSYIAKDYVMDNIELIKEAYTEFGQREKFADDFFDERWEDIDVTIRCYLLGQCIAAALDEIEDELTFAEDVEESGEEESNNTAA